MDLKIKLKINDRCDCNISIFLRDIIELGLKPVMENIATVIAASLIDKELFGYYEVNYLFVMGDPLNLSYGSTIYNAYSTIAQQAIDVGVYSKEKDTQIFIFRDSFCQLIQPGTRSKPYMYERFVTGTLCQVSSETYAVRLPKQLPFMERFASFFLINRNEEIKDTINGYGRFLILIQKGRPISIAKLFMYDRRKFHSNYSGKFIIILVIIFLI